MAAEAETLVLDAAEYRRTVQRFRTRVRNGWSQRTQTLAEYLGGTYVRLDEMAEGLLTLLRHKAGIE